MRLGSRFWLSRSLPVLVVGLVVLALGLFVEWPPPIGYLVGLAGVLIVVAWALGFPRGRARERREKVDRRMATAERRQHVMEAEAERRAGRERLPRTILAGALPCSRSSAGPSSSSSSSACSSSSASSS